MAAPTKLFKPTTSRFSNAVTSLGQLQDVYDGHGSLNATLNRPARWWQHDLKHRSSKHFSTVRVSSGYLGKFEREGGAEVHPNINFLNVTSSMANCLASS